MPQNLIVLYTIIKAMTPNQKRSFTMQCNLLETNSKVLTLFNALNKLEKYDKEELVKYLQKNNKYELIENLLEEATSLYDLLVEKLLSITNERSIKRKLRKTFNEIVLLQEMGCLTKALSMLKKLKKDAIEYDLKILLLEVYKYEREFISIISITLPNIILLPISFRKL